MRLYFTFVFNLVFLYCMFNICIPPMFMWCMLRLLMWQDGGGLREDICIVFVFAWYLYLYCILWCMLCLVVDSGWVGRLSYLDFISSEHTTTNQCHHHHHHHSHHHHHHRHYDHHQSHRPRMCLFFCSNLQGQQQRSS